MKTYVINLERRTDRMVELMKNTPFAFERFPATDGSIFKDEENRFLRGHYGCWDSHRRLLRKIRDEGHETCLVLEDDCKFTENAGMDMLLAMNELPEDWDLVYLGGDNRGEIKPYSPNLNIAETVYQTHAYIVRKKFLDTLIETLEARRYKVDVVFCDALPKGKCFILNPVIATQRDSYSDITMR